jgi:hypothetical protein
MTVPNFNPESVTSALSNPKSNPIAVVAYSNSYGPSLQFLAAIKTALQETASIQLLAINADDHRHLLGLPILAMSEVPSLVLFWKGRPVSQPITDQFRATSRLKRFSRETMESDDFEPVGTTFKTPTGTNISRWISSGGSKASPSDSALMGILTPLWTIMDSIYDI